MSNDVTAAGPFSGHTSLPRIIQGGMGVGVSHHHLARAVARAGGMGVVSGTAIDTVLARRLQDGDPTGEMRWAMERFPNSEVVDAVLARYFRPHGREGRPYRGVPMHSHRDGHAAQDLCVLAAFVEVTLAKRDHHGMVGINLLTKVQIPTVPTLFGAMMAGVDCVLMGAGIPRHIPGVLDALAVPAPVTTTLEMVASAASPPQLHFDPARFGAPSPLVRPAFLPIVSSHALAEMLARKSTGTVQGFIVEGPSAGGHNAPPRGAPVFDESGQPLYGERDRVDLHRVAEIGLPYWLAGGYDTPASVAHALADGATGVQVGTLFAFCRDSGVAPALRHAVLARVREGDATVFTSATASPTGYPFKVASLSGTLSEPAVYARRERKCDMGYLREAYTTANGSVRYRCPAEPVEDYVAKGGNVADTVGRHCLCNSLTATIGLGQMRGDLQEPPLVTSGDGLNAVAKIADGGGDYGAADVLEYLLGDLPTA